MEQNIDNPVSSVAERYMDISQIDERSVALREELLKLQVRRNDLTSFSGRLPPEVLCRIFLECLSFDELSKKPPVRRVWLQLTQVCHQWREVALNYPRLWSDISFVSGFWARTSLQRSKAAPITVNSRTITAFPEAENSRVNLEIQEALKDALFQMYRIQTLSISSAPEICARQLLPLSAPPDSNQKVAAPLLECLKLSKCEIFTRHNETVVTLDDRFLNGGTPNLRTLKMDRIKLAWGPMRIFENLTSFIYENPRDTSPPLAPPFIEALSNMQELKYLRLDMVYPQFTDAGLDGRVAKLPALEQLLMKNGNADAYGGLLSHLALPTSTRITLQCWIARRPNTASGLRHLASTLSSSWLDAPLSSLSGESPIQLEYFRIRGEFTKEKPSDLLVKGWKSMDFEDADVVAVLCGDQQNQKQSAFCLDVAGDWPDVAQDPADFTDSNPNNAATAHDNFINENDVCPVRAVPLAGAKVLLLEGGMERAAIQRYLARLPFVHTVLCADKWSLFEFIGCLCVDPVFEVDEDPNDPDRIYRNRLDGNVRYFTNMVHLVIIGVKFNSELWGPVLKGLLYALVNERQRYGGQIQKISFVRCSGLKERHLTKFRKFVREVTWMEKPTEASSSSSSLTEAAQQADSVHVDL
ncbi:hypothetical protein FA15DRAFT_632840 [Coprinopsis marcescibilis]|uniref:F-box domain-containing protein n=1 Tax=Coprinopsis marcescibilis TaxID=230819 RepID=A0A5C3L8G6_COPMA|nr:hypothetical protein FA15DRAFT_632840 [Coprinopsis marcescibilis]